MGRTYLPSLAEKKINSSRFEIRVLKIFSIESGRHFFPCLKGNGEFNKFGIFLGVGHFL